MRKLMIQKGGGQMVEPLIVAPNLIKSILEETKLANPQRHNREPISGQLL